ncbi:QWRF family [Artemisia annua]|uniref:QWRF family n=1 Tax=Artemisia annua TaxID=35608 RepID=A0A2U1N4U8_ARTAN|nr:QWRF family [Artemisia annua]
MVQESFKPRNFVVNPVSKRSVSADRRGPTSKLDLISTSTTLKPNNVVDDVAVVTSSRSVSVSFQGQAFSLPISKTKVHSSPLKGRRNGGGSSGSGVSLRVNDCVENAKPLLDKCRWPARIRQGTNVSVFEKKSFGGLVEESKSRVNNLEFLGDSDTDTDSVSSGSTNSGFQENGGSRSGPGGIVVSARFWQETNSRMRRLQDMSSPGSKVVTPQKVSNSKRFSSEGPLSSPRRMASPNRMRPSSPSKFMLSPSPSRGMVSPRRNSVSGIGTNISETPSVLSFAVDVRRGKVGENRFFDAHYLRLLYNRQLQWRFVNARSEDLVLKQKRNAEENIWNAWITISDLRDSVTKKRHRLQLLRQKLKLASILKAQIVFLEDWAHLDTDHSLSLLGAIEALKASTLRLPVGTGATADLQTMKDAINSALDVMQAIFSSSHSVCLQVEEVNMKVAELAKVSAKERALIRICKDFLSVLSALKVKDSSLRAHMLQTSCVN